MLINSVSGDSVSATISLYELKLLHVILEVMSDLSALVENGPVSDKVMKSYLEAGFDFHRYPWLVIAKSMEINMRPLASQVIGPVTAREIAEKKAREEAEAELEEAGKHGVLKLQ